MLNLKLLKSKNKTLYWQKWVQRRLRRHTKKLSS